MKLAASGLLVLLVGALSGCTTIIQQASADFRPPEGNYKLIVMRPDINVSVLTAGGALERREDWTNQARANVLNSLQSQQAKRGGTATIARSVKDAGADPKAVADLDRLHEAVGRAIQLHKYTPGTELPTKKNLFDWTLGQEAVDYGRVSGYDYALFLYASDSFSSGGRVALQAVGMLGCVVGVCIVTPSGRQSAFVSLVELKTGKVVWFNYPFSENGDIRTQKGADQLVENLLNEMKPGTPQTKG